MGITYVELSYYICCFAIIFLIYSVAVICLLIRSWARKKEIAKIKEQVEMKEVYLKYLQIKPHFVYNTLSTIYVLIEEDPQRAQRMLYKFTRYLQMNAQIAESKGLVKFTEAIQYLEYYVDIMKEKYPLLEVDIDLETEDFLFPPFVLQPIVENSILHGFRSSNREGHITIHSESRGSRVLISIEDNGAGTKDEAKAEGFGLKNIRERVEIQLNGTMEVEMNPGKGTKVLLNVERRME